MAITTINSEIVRIQSFLPLNGIIFYNDEKISFDATIPKINADLSIYKQDLESIRKSLEARKANLFQKIDLPIQEHNEKSIQTHASTINAIIHRNNG